MAASTQRFIEPSRGCLGNRIFAGGIDLEQIKHVGIVERPEKFIEEIAQTGKAMRLKDSHDAPAKSRARRRERGANLHRMMPVIVKYEATRRFAFDFEAPGKAGERRERARGRVERDAQLECDADRRKRV